MLLKFVSVLSLISILGACSSGDGGISGTGFDIKGAAQKGPFALGSSVLVNYLTEAGESSSETITTETIDDLGNFEFTINRQAALRISVQGYNFNEILGKLSDSTLTLRAIYSATDTVEQNASVNVLTHLIHNRVLKLIETGSAASAAIDQAQLEFIATFQKVLIVDNVADFTNLNIYNLEDQFTDSNAYLLALSAVVYQYAISKANIKENSIDAELTSVLNYLALDFADDGEISDEVMLGDLATASRLVRPNNIEENLANRSYQVTNQRLQVV